MQLFLNIMLGLHKTVGSVQTLDTHEISNKTSLLDSFWLQPNEGKYLRSAFGSSTIQRLKSTKSIA